MTVAGQRGGKFILDHLTIEEPRKNQGAENKQDRNNGRDSAE